MSLATTIREKSALIWAIADKLTGAYMPHQYGDVILPMTVIRRFDCILADTKQAVLARYPLVKDLALHAPEIEEAAGYPFYNVSPYDFNRLLDDPDHLAENFRSYLNGFSENVRDIIEHFKFDDQINTMVEKGLLYEVIREFTTAKADLHPSKVSNIEMGYVFEEIIRKFSEAANASAGQHYTPREVIRLMVNILFAEDNDLLSQEGAATTVYDPACGTGGMLTVAEEYLHDLNQGARIIPIGQEINDQTYAVCKADILIKGHDATQIRLGNTLSQDQFPGSSFDYILSNPPFGREWKNEESAVLAEAKLGAGGRFEAGLPAKGDGQLLFLLTALAKMKSPAYGGSRIAIIHNGSPLFTGDAGSGPSNIRKYIIEHDLLDAIIALPNNIFYNTGIATYIWVLTNRKPDHRKGKVQLINANELFTKMRKCLGEKRNEISDAQIAEITQLYGNFTESPICKIFPNEAFGFAKITIERPLCDESGQPVLKKGKVQPDKARRDTENVPLTETIETYFAREVLPYAPDAWIDTSKTVIGYEIPFTRYFYQYTMPRAAKEVMAEIMTLDEELEGAFKEIFSE